MSNYSRKIVGRKYTATYQTYITHNDKTISPFHEIPLFMDHEHVNVINEIPRFENAKFEINTKKALNPITQDIKNGKPRFVANIFPCKGYPWNYGALPQTWEDPDIKDKNTNCLGDNDPLDVIEIGNVMKKIGEVYAAKIIGCLGLIDGGECDWKVIVIDLRDEKAKTINDINDLKMSFPGLQTVTYNWFKNYKMADGKPKNEFLDYGELKNKEFTMKIIRECHKSWKKMMGEKFETKISRAVSNAQAEVSLPDTEKKPDESVPESLAGFFYAKDD